MCDKALSVTGEEVAHCIWAVLEKDMKWRNDGCTAETTDVPTCCATQLQPKDSIKIWLRA